jgi:hypothetical protein
MRLCSSRVMLGCWSWAISHPGCPNSPVSSCFERHSQIRGASTSHYGTRLTSPIFSEFVWLPFSSNEKLQRLGGGWSRIDERFVNCGNTRLVNRTGDADVGKRFHEHVGKFFPGVAEGGRLPLEIPPFNR